MTSLLESIKTPEDIKLFSIQELKDLAQEVRTRILTVLSVTGGHLASNLGSVELTLALHTVFNSPIDKFIFDVSHQTYTHKLLTGRNDKRFEKIRQTNGLSGFCHPQESEHDHFFAGHAGTALSLALGMTKARDLMQGSEHIIPIIGDATLTCGLSLEALNNIRRETGRLIVILNDNAMSISQNVGGITHILSRLLSNPTTSRLVHDLESLLAKIPRLGRSLAKKGHKFTESIKNLVSSAPFFEQFNLSYIGPIDGHDVKKMISVFEAVKDLPMPVIIHLFTKKGQGVEQAEKDPITYHGVKPFDPTTCEFLPSQSKNPSFPKVFGKHLLKMAEQDSSIVAITPAMSLGSCLDPFMTKFPDRCIDVGIAEGHAVTYSAGIAKDRRLKVICSIYSTFLQRALDNLFHDVCLQDIPVVFAIDRAGIASGDGATHHGIYDLGFLTTMPGMVICHPRNGHVLKELMESCFSWGRPVAIRYPNLETEEPNLPVTARACGKGELLQGGDDLLIIAMGHLCSLGLKIAEQFATKGISVAVLDPVFLKPLDTDLLSELLLKHQRIITLEEHSLKGGLAVEIDSFLQTFGFTQVQTLHFGIPDRFFDQASYQDLLTEMGMTPDAVVQKALLHFAFDSYSLRV